MLSNGTYKGFTLYSSSTLKVLHNYQKEEILQLSLCYKSSVYAIVYKIQPTMCRFIDYEMNNGRAFKHKEFEENITDIQFINREYFAYTLETKVYIYKQEILERVIHCTVFSLNIIDDSLNKVAYFDKSVFILDSNDSANDLELQPAWKVQNMTFNKKGEKLIVLSENGEYLFVYSTLTFKGNSQPIQ